MKSLNIAIIGMGALGLLYGSLLRADPEARVGFIVDEERLSAYREQTPVINGVPTRFTLLDSRRDAVPADLVIFAVKATALDKAMEDAAGFVGPDTILLSLLNGITSEQALARRFGDKNLVYCVAQGMDATRQGRALRYTRTGTLCLGLPGGADSPALRALLDQLERSGVPYVREADILHRIWSKFMLNVGVNQVVMVCQGNYGTIQRPGEARELMIAAMREVIALSEAEGVPVTEEDLRYYVDLLSTLDPEGMPSMRQDGLARRKSEVELFSGTVCRLAQKHGIPAPVNEWLYKTIRDMECDYEASR